MSSSDSATATPASTTPPSIPPLLRRLLPVLALLSAVSPLSTDMYLAALPQMARDFGAEASGVQLTLTAFLIGLALGQLFIGPLSDGIGRRRPLIVGTSVCFLASLACVFAPNLDWFIAARFVQGASGAAGVVLARAIIADTSQGVGAARFLGLMMMIGGLAPITAPLMGSGLLLLGDWRLIFAALALLVAAMCWAVWFKVPETLPVERRQTGGLRALLANAGKVLRHRPYVGYLLTFVGSFGVLFAYLSASPFVLQNVLGMSPSAYGLMFAVNAVGVVSANACSVRLAGRVPVQRLLATGVTSLWVVCALQMLNVALGPWPLPTLVLMFFTTASFGLIAGNATALALGTVPQWSGTASAFIGAFNFGIGAVVSPLVGLAGDHSALPMALVMIVMSSTAMLAFWTLAHRTAATPGAPRAKD
jgi:DHA1 family bicyclomycin/chloramphenicol resistance-like MFS transporter